MKGADATWENVDKFVKEALATATNVRIVSNTIMSPSTKLVIADFAVKYPSTKHITFDASSYSGMINANNNSFGKAVIPSYNFDKADVIVSFGADFLGTWISPVEYTKQYVQNRNNKKLRSEKNVASRTVRNYS